MQSTGSADDRTGTEGGPSRRRLLASLAAGTVIATGRAAGRPGGDVRGEAGLPETDGRSAARAADRPQASGTWPSFQFDARNTGHARSIRGPRSEAGARWGYVDGGSLEATPVVTSDTVYAADASGAVVAVGRTDGSERWRVESPVGDGRVAYADGSLFVPADELEVRNPADGSVEWTVRVGDPRSVVVAGQYAYVASATGAYRVDPGTESVAWHVDRVKQLQPGLAVTEDTVYAVGERYGQVIAVDRATGGRRWLRRIEGSSLGAPTAAGTRVVVPGDAGLVGLSYESGLTKWTYDASVRSSVAVADDVVYATDEGDDVFALDLETGEEHWRRAVVPGSNPPVVAGGLLYVTGTEGTVAAISPADGSIRWRASVGGERTSNVAVAGGELYVGDLDGRLAALAGGESGGLLTPTPADTRTPESSGGAESTDAPGTATASPVDEGAPGFGVLAGAVATGVGALLARRRASNRDEGDG